MSRSSSPPTDQRSPKRPRASLEPVDMAQLPDNIAKIVPDGDAVLVISGMSTAPNTLIGLRVSSHALSMASPVFKALFAMAAANSDKATNTNPPQNIVSVPNDDGDAMYILANILHLRNDQLPMRIPPNLLCKIACLARKYECVVAAGRATVQWFDRLYASKDKSDTWRIVEAAFLLDEPMFFARFTSRWVFEASVHDRSIPIASTADTKALSLLLADQATKASAMIRVDLDTMVDPCTIPLSKESRHYIDWAPQMSPTPEHLPDGKPATECRVDSDGAALYLGALRDAGLWPSTVWTPPRDTADGKGETIGSLIEKLADFREPEYDDADKCEFCEGVKIAFTEELERMQESHRIRLWGLCLDCYRAAGGMNLGECRFEHTKFFTERAREALRASQATAVQGATTGN